MKRILIFYTSVGLGHKIIAENIGWHLTRAGYEVKLFDILEVQSGFLVDAGTWLHQFINRRIPFVWRFLYNSHGFHKLTLRWRVPLAAKNSRRAARAIAEFRPDLVISTQTTGSAIVSYLKREGLYTGKFAIAFSDYHLHSYWLYDEADLYFANIPEQKDEMVRQGIPIEKIAVVGMTLQPRPQLDLVAVRSRLDIAPNEQVVLMASGSLGTGVSPKWIEGVVRVLGVQSPSARVVIVCGKNEKLRVRLAGLLKDTSALVFGYYSPGNDENGQSHGMVELYAIADIFITKPGGLSVAESLAWQLPLLVTHWLPGQEELNYVYLNDKKLIMPVKPTVSQEELGEIVADELDTHEFKKSLSHNNSWSDLIQENRLGQAIIQAVSQVLK